MIRAGRIAFVFGFLLFLPRVILASPVVILSTSTVIPGQTLRVEIDEVSPTEKLKAVFLGKSYPFFPVGPNAQRALIGIKLGTTAQDTQLKFRRAGDPTGEVPNLAPIAVTIAGREYATENITLPKAKKTLVSREGRESAKIHAASRVLSARQFWEGTFVSPVNGPEIGEFGKKRVHNGKDAAGYHNGIDLRAPMGSPVSAANAGVVRLATPFRAHGKTVLIDHGQGVATVYLHLKSFAVKPGDKVKKGQTIGRVGSTGVSTGPHVHWQVFVHGVPVDPTAWTTTEF